MTNFKEMKEVHFELKDAVTYGLKTGKYSGYSISVVLDDKSTKKIKSLVEEHEAKDPFYRSTIYLKIRNLAEKQKEELLNKGKAHVMISFKTTGIYEKDNVNYIQFRVTKLRKLDAVDSEDECPEV